MRIRTLAGGVACTAIAAVVAISVSQAGAAPAPSVSATAAKASAALVANPGGVTEPASAAYSGDVFKDPSTTEPLHYDDIVSQAVAATSTPVSASDAIASVSKQSLSSGLTPGTPLVALRSVARPDAASQDGDELTPIGTTPKLAWVLAYKDSVPNPHGPIGVDTTKLANMPCVFIAVVDATSGAPLLLEQTCNPLG